MPFDPITWSCRDVLPVYGATNAVFSGNRKEVDAVSFAKPLRISVQRVDLQRQTACCRKDRREGPAAEYAPEEPLLCPKQRRLVHQEHLCSGSDREAVRGLSEAIPWAMPMSRSGSSWAQPGVQTVDWNLPTFQNHKGGLRLAASKKQHGTRA